ncbi:MAG TPA: hypothetical protein VFH39_03770 [Candidatus Saccharimonadales bacterium]|nr:hypothetical protein [Candidatus Saccharimonadales bacterium]
MDIQKSYATVAFMYERMYVPEAGEPICVFPVGPHAGRRAHKLEKYLLEDGTWLEGFLRGGQPARNYDHNEHDPTTRTSTVWEALDRSGGGEPRTMGFIQTQSARDAVCIRRGMITRRLDREKDRERRMDISAALFHAALHGRDSIDVQVRCRKMMLLDVPPTIAGYTENVRNLLYVMREGRPWLERAEEHIHA